VKARLGRGGVCDTVDVPSCPTAHTPASAIHFRIWGIVLQNSKVAGLRIFTKNMKRKTIADSYNFNRATEVAYEFNAGR
jgi:hypothetical protein